MLSGDCNFEENAKAIYRHYNGKIIGKAIDYLGVIQAVVHANEFE